MSGAPPKVNPAANVAGGSSTFESSTFESSVFESRSSWECCLGGEGRGDAVFLGKRRERGKRERGEDRRGERGGRMCSVIADLVKGLGIDNWVEGFGSWGLGFENAPPPRTPIRP